MSLSQEERDVMFRLEIERAERILQKEVPVQRDAHLWNMLANRLYYAVFHAVCALLIKNGIQCNTHKGVHMMFNEKFVRTGIFTEYDRLTLSQLESLRDQGDYNCFLDTTEEQVMPHIQRAENLISKIKIELTK